MKSRLVDHFDHLSEKHINMTSAFLDDGVHPEQASDQQCDRYDEERQYKRNGECSKSNHESTSTKACSERPNSDILTFLT